MRIAIVQLSFYTPGGAERVLDRLIGHLGIRHEFAIFAFDYHTLNYQSLDASKRYVVRPQKPIFGRLRRYARAKRYRLLKKAINQWSADVVLLNKEIDLAEWMSNSIDVPVVPYLHGQRELSYRLANIESSANIVHRYSAKPSSLYRRLVGESNPRSPLPGRCNTVICVSGSTAGQLNKYWPHVKTFVVQNGVDHSRFYPTWEDKGYALCISRLVPSKNLEFLLHAFRSADYPLIIHGSLEGGAQSAKDYLRRLESLKGLQTRIVIHHDEDSMIQLLQRSSVVLHPGLDEGFPLVPIEAMACGKVVVGHNSGGTPEVIGDHGFLAGDDESQWVSIVNRLMDSATLRANLGRDAYEYSKKYSWEKTSADFESALESVV